MVRFSWLIVPWDTFATRKVDSRCWTRSPTDVPCGGGQSKRDAGAKTSPINGWVREVEGGFGRFEARNPERHETHERGVFSSCTFFSSSLSCFNRWARSLLALALACELFKALRGFEGYRETTADDQLCTPTSRFVNLLAPDIGVGSEGLLTLEVLPHESALTLV